MHRFWFLLVIHFLNMSMSKIAIHTTTSDSLSYIKAEVAKQLDVDLMTPVHLDQKGISTPVLKGGGFSIESLMELAGLSVAYGVYDYLQHKSIHNNSLQNKSVLLLCGPGNNGGDALVAARHLYHWGHIPTVYYPNMEKVIQNLHANNSSNLYANLLLQLQNLNIPILTSLPDVIDSSYYAPYDGIVDGFFGFSYDASRVMKEPYRRVLDSIIQAHRLLNVISIDIPSGWDINSQLINYRS